MENFLKTSRNSKIANASCLWTPGFLVFSNFYKSFTLQRAERAISDQKIIKLVDKHEKELAAKDMQHEKKKELWCREVTANKNKLLVCF